MNNFYSKTKSANQKVGKVNVLCLLVCFVLFFVNLVSFLHFNPIFYKNDSIGAADYWGEEVVDLKFVKNNSFQERKMTIKTTITSADEFSYFFIKFLGKEFSSTYTNDAYSYFFEVSLANNIDLGAKIWGSVIIPQNCTFTFYGRYNHIEGLKLDGKKSKGLISSSNSNGDIIFEHTRIHVDLVATCGKDTNIGAFVGYSKGKVEFFDCYTYGKLGASYSNSSGVYCSGSIGGYAGKVGNFCAKNCTNTINIYALNFENVGGFVGRTTIGYSQQVCTNMGSIGGSSVYMGGLAGYVRELNLYRARCCNIATISNVFNYINYSETFGATGGLVGFVESVEALAISYVFNNNKISSKYGIAGGIIGDSNVSLSFMYVYNSGDVSTTKNIGTKDVKHRISLEKSSYPILDTDKLYEITMAITGYTIIHQVRRDVSLIGDDDKILDKSECYCVKPSCFCGEENYSYSVDVNFYKGFGGMVIPTAIRSLTFTSDLISNYASKDTCSFAYGTVSTIIGKFGNRVNVARNIYDGNMYYINNLFPYGKSLSTLANVEYDFQNIKCKVSGNNYSYTSKLQSYIENMMRYMMYSEFKSDSFRQNGINKNWLTTNTSIVDLFTQQHLSLSISGARMYLGFNSDSTVLKEIIICPLIYSPKSWCEGKYYYDTYIPFLMPPEDPDDEEKKEIRFQINQPLADNSKDDYVTISQIKSKNFGTKYFTQKDSINGGLPIFKEMYWEI